VTPTRSLSPINNNNITNKTLNKMQPFNNNNFNNNNINNNNFNNGYE